MARSAKKSTRKAKLNIKIGNAAIKVTGKGVSRTWNKSLDKSRKDFQKGLDRARKNFERNLNRTRRDLEYRWLKFNKDLNRAIKR